eukprot:TRINITY_DN17943_c0_g2_i5.p1 TRINITY_DN17943_c0_g2~~TRINITY_DN17943_c0_g2_i5.p1  ORF type:complete len:171 (+),score=22.99 TRINITY_DN17943_c0_g2_i5:84-596(+)
MLDPCFRQRILLNESGNHLIYSKDRRSFTDPLNVSRGRRREVSMRSLLFEQHKAISSGLELLSIQWSSMEMSSLYQFSGYLELISIQWMLRAYFNISIQSIVGAYCSSVDTWRLISVQWILEALFQFSGGMEPISIQLILGGLFNSVEVRVPNAQSQLRLEKHSHFLSAR